MLEREPGLMVMTDFGWALESNQPIRKDLYWVPTGTTNVYWFDGDGWVRVRPPERVPHNGKELAHG